MDQRTSVNQKYYYFIIFAMAVVMIFTFKFYVSQRKENQALKLKLMLANQERRRPKPWGRLTASQPARSQASKKETMTKDTMTTDVVSTGQAAPVRTDAVPLKNRETDELAGELNNRMNNIKRADLPEIGRTIEIADELILREPETYSAYKAKLIALLTREGKFGITADDNEVNGLLEDMARFDITSDKAIQKEAALISNANAEAMLMEQKINETRTQITNIESQMAQLGLNSPEYRALDSRRAVLSLQEDDDRKSLTSIEDQIQLGEFPPDNYVNEDVVQIPFMRLMARDDYAAAADNAESFIQQFPNSPLGYYYLVLALEKMGRKEDAVDVLARSRLGTTDQEALLERLSTARLENPKQYWEKLKF